MARWGTPDYEGFRGDEVAQANQFMQMALLCVGGGTGPQWKNRVLDSVVELAELQAHVGPITQARPIMGVIREVTEVGDDVPRGLVRFEALSGNRDSNDLEEIKTDPVRGGRGKYVYERAKQLIGHRVFLFKYMEPNHRGVKAGGTTPEAFKNLVGIIDLGPVSANAAAPAVDAAPAAAPAAAAAAPAAAAQPAAPAPAAAASPSEDEIKAAGQAASEDLRNYATSKGMTADELKAVIVANQLNTFAALADPVKVAQAKQAIDEQAAAKAAAATTPAAEPAMAGPAPF